jgi:periplasmic protein TonB
MGARLFEDVVVSPSAFTRRGGGFPVSAGLHAVAMAAALVAYGRSPIEPPPVHVEGIFTLPPGIDLPVRVPDARPVRPSAATKAGPRVEAPPRVAVAQLAAATSEPIEEAPQIGGDPVEPGEGAGGGCPNCPTAPDGGGGQGGGGSDNSTGGTPTTVRPGGNIQPPRKLHHVNPQYPEPARAIRLQGTVVLECTIGTDGRVADVRVLQGSPLLEGAAVAAVQQWIYTPTRLNGQPVAVIMTVTVRFALP